MALSPLNHSSTGDGVKNKNKELFSHNKHQNSRMWYDAVEYTNALLESSEWGSDGVTIRGLTALVSKALVSERNTTQCSAVASSNTHFSIDKVFHMENTCGVYACTPSYRIVREVTTDNPMHALVNACLLLCVLLFYYTLRMGYVRKCVSRVEAMVIRK
jgi:hypothetical protein